ncbi:hypothetical protein R3P38DRAFT_2759344 [Favolaschia claudopus]|uniref:Uncharacterized protein n=1 Tax=Favolaschia claudopus TaxID=2862362 RepID=A0AAW0E611_9AGAR
MSTNDTSSSRVLQALQWHEAFQQPEPLSISSLHHPIPRRPFPRLSPLARSPSPRPSSPPLTRWLGEFQVDSTPSPSSPPLIRAIFSQATALAINNPRPSSPPRIRWLGDSQTDATPPPSSPPLIRAISPKATALAINKRLASSPPPSSPPLLWRRRLAGSPPSLQPSREPEVCLTVWLANGEKPAQIVLPVWGGKLSLANHKVDLGNLGLEMGESRLEKYTPGEGWGPLMWGDVLQIGNGTTAAIRVRTVEIPWEDWNEEDFDC